MAWPKPSVMSCKCSHASQPWIDFDSHIMCRWMSKEPAEIFERAAEEGFIRQVRAAVETCLLYLCIDVFHSSSTIHLSLNSAS